MRTQRVKYIGLIRNCEDEDDFFENVLRTMTYDICGFVHVEGLALENACAGCGECMVNNTYGIYKLAHDGAEPPPEEYLGEMFTSVEVVFA